MAICQAVRAVRSQPMSLPFMATFPAPQTMAAERARPTACRFPEISTFSSTPSPKRLRTMPQIFRQESFSLRKILARMATQMGMV